MKKWIIFTVVLIAAAGVYFIAQSQTGRKLSAFTPWSNEYKEMELTEQQKADIANLLEPLATWGYLKLAFNQSEIEARGDKIRPIPFMKFLAYIFSDPQMKAYMTKIRSRGSIWSRFGASLRNSLAEQKADGNLEKYLKPFSEEVGISEETFMPYIDSQNWSGFLNVLFTAPRAPKELTAE
ncbi:MAG: hypothetical protein H7A40_01415 [Chlamydiales bacterium]|nr:hypothetical protein [Chlamydiales bacterium]